MSVWFSFHNSGLWNTICYPFLFKIILRFSIVLHKLKLCSQKLFSQVSQPVTLVPRFQGKFSFCTLQEWEATQKYLFSSYMCERYVWHCAVPLVLLPFPPRRSVFSSGSYFLQCFPSSLSLFLLTLLPLFPFLFSNFWVWNNHIPRDITCLSQDT